MATKRRSGSKSGKPKRPTVADVVKAHKMYVNAINSNSTKRVMACYDTDAVVMPPNDHNYSTPAAIKGWVAAYFDSCKTHWIKKSKVMWVAGEYGFDQGVDTFVDKPYDKTQPISRGTVKGILIYKWQKSGKFLVYRDIWGNMYPPQAYYPK